jgi:uncharacterized YigZ family protein
MSPPTKIAGVAELVDAWDLKSHGIFNPVSVRVRPSAFFLLSVPSIPEKRSFSVIMSQRYPIPAHTVRTEITSKRSRFIATIGYADTVEAAKAFIRDIRAEMPDAAHHVYAFRVGYGSSVTEGLSDDGEPPGTSGKPVMAVIRGADLGDVVIVVTRYFGGTKLGTGGLVRAYGGAAKAALEQLSVTEKVATVTLEAQLPYHCYDQVKRLLAEHEASLVNEIFSAQITVQLTVPTDCLNRMSQRLREFTVENREPQIVNT